jgi:small subunit ribosomal protein S16
MGAKKRPFYRLVVADARSPRDGRFIEAIGTYDPLASPAVVRVDAERVREWISKGAKPTDIARQLLVREGVLEQTGPRYEKVDSAPKPSKKQQARARAAEEAAAQPPAEPVPAEEPPPTADATAESEPAAEPAAAAPAAAEEPGTAAPAAAEEGAATADAAAAPEAQEPEAAAALEAEPEPESEPQVEEKAK